METILKLTHEYGGELLVAALAAIIRYIEKRRLEKAKQ